MLFHFHYCAADEDAVGTQTTPTRDQMQSSLQPPHTQHRPPDPFQVLFDRPIILVHVVHADDAARATTSSRAIQTDPLGLNNSSNSAITTTTTTATSSIAQLHTRLGPNLQTFNPESPNHRTKNCPGLGELALLLRRETLHVGLDLLLGPLHGFELAEHIAKHG